MRIKKKEAKDLSKKIFGVNEIITKAIRGGLNEKQIVYAMQKGMNIDKGFAQSLFELCTFATFKTVEEMKRK